jgi:hypothetical protein
MNNPGYKSLGVFDITITETIVGDWIENLEGMISALVGIRFIYGSSGTSVKAYLQTTSDDGSTACDIACVVFDTVSEHKLLNFTAAPKLTQVTPTDKALADDTAVDGILGNKFRLAVVVVGTYAGSTQVVAGINAR